MLDVHRHRQLPQILQFPAELEEGAITVLPLVILPALWAHRRETARRMGKPARRILLISVIMAVRTIAIIQPAPNLALAEDNLAQLPELEEEALPEDKADVVQADPDREAAGRGRSAISQTEAARALFPAGQPPAAPGIRTAVYQIIAAKADNAKLVSQLADANPLKLFKPDFGWKGKTRDKIPEQSRQENQ